MSMEDDTALERVSLWRAGSADRWGSQPVSQARSE